MNIRWLLYIRYLTDYLKNALIDILRLTSKSLLYSIDLCQ